MSAVLKPPVEPAPPKSLSTVAVTIGIVAGEASGDALAATLIHGVRARLPNASFVGIAGPKMMAAGCESWYPLETLSVRGFSEVAGKLPQLIRIRGALASRFVSMRIPLFIGVDAPDFNLGLERTLKRRRVRTVHFVSPSVWAWREGRVATIRRSADRLLALFPFEPEIYKGSGVPVTFVGHPMAHNAATALSRREMRSQLRLGIGQPVFALLPGSRQAELDMHSELLLQAAAVIQNAKPDARFLVPLATRSTRDKFEATLYKLKLEHLPVTLLYGHAGEALKAADVALVASGTATLEAALARCPHVIYYRMTSITYRIVHPKLLLPWVGLPNIIARRFVVPELLQDDATVDNLAQAVLNLYDDIVTRHRVEAVFGDMAASLRADTGALAADAVTAELRLAGVAC